MTDVDVAWVRPPKSGETVFYRDVMGVVMDPRDGRPGQCEVGIFVAKFNSRGLIRVGAPIECFQRPVFELPLTQVGVGV